MPKMKKDAPVVKASDLWSEDDHTNDRATYQAVPKILEDFTTWNGLNLEEDTNE